MSTLTYNNGLTIGIDGGGNSLEAFHELAVACLIHRAGDLEAKQIFGQVLDLLQERLCFKVQAVAEALV